uniref:SH3 domain-containing protein n=1 Tax=Oncorhynchus tshawytscha TaxID=74940 RepID=A0AAZ3R0A2_ONCTS
MWKSVVGHNVSIKVAEGDDWETDPDFENDVSEQEQRWGAKTIEGSGRKEHISVSELRQKVSQEHEVGKQKERAEAPKASYGYGGKFGVEKDRMDKGAVGHGYVAQVEQHSSQTDAKRGFGGKFGVQKDRVDKSAMGFEYKGEVEQHTSQKDYSKGFGGKYGVEKEKVDKAALGYDYKGETEKHQSQKDYSKGFGGKFGVEKEKVDKAALGYDYKGETEKHESQKDYAKGFGGRYGVQTDRMDKSAVAFTDMESPTSAYEKTIPMEACKYAHFLWSREEEEEPVYDQPPCLPPRSSDLLEAEPPQEQTPSEPEQEDEGEYEDISPIPFPEPDPGQCATPSGVVGFADDEISYNPDDVITNIEMVDEGWWKGHCHGRIGLFPATFVKMM